MAGTALRHIRRLRALLCGVGFAVMLSLASATAAFAGGGLVLETVTDVPDSGTEEPSATDQASELVPVQQPIDEGAGEPAGPVQATGDPIVEGAAGVIEPVLDEARPGIAPILDMADPAVEAVSPVVEPVAEIARPVIDPVLDVVKPVIDPIGEVIDPVLDVVEPVIDPVVPIVDPVVPIVDPILPIVDAIDPIDPIVDVVAPGHDPSEAAGNPGGQGSGTHLALGAGPLTSAASGERFAASRSKHPIAAGELALRSSPGSRPPSSDLPALPPGSWPASLPSGTMNALISLVGGLAMALLGVAVLGRRSSGSFSLESLVIPLRGRSPVPVVPPA